MPVVAPADSSHGASSAIGDAAATTAAPTTASHGSRDGQSEASERGSDDTLRPVAHLSRLRSASATRQRSSAPRGRLWPPLPRPVESRSFSQDTASNLASASETEGIQATATTAALTQWLGRSDGAYTCMFVPTGIRAVLQRHGQPSAPFSGPVTETCVIHSKTLAQVANVPASSSSSEHDADTVEPPVLCT